VKFQQACLTDLDSDRFYFQDIENTEGYRWGYGKVRRKNSVFLRENQEDMPYEQGIFVDVFPRDGIPDGFFAGKIHKLICYVLRKSMWSAIGRKTDKSFFNLLCYQCLYRICSKKHTLQFYRKLIKWSNSSPTKLTRALTFPLPKNVQGYERNWYQNYTDIEFEGYIFQAEAGYKEWLLREFGDYMQLPPPEKRKTHPVSKIEFPMDRSNNE
ncbi:MAG: LicD family protein, partial [Selenomonadaceae bacterium]|nr:LicD family protein [Selenomonadaceae bacterium]